MDDLWSDIQRRLDLLDVALREVGKRGREYAEAEAAYRAALSTKILELRADKMPVTICPDIARGTAEIARLRLDRDCKEALFLAAKEAVNVNKLRVKILDAQLEREWRG